MSIYQDYEQTLHEIADDLIRRIKDNNESYYAQNGTKVYEHLSCRIKSDESMREKCQRKGLQEDVHSALVELKDAIGIRIVTSFVDDIFENLEFIKSIPYVSIINEKDYIRHSKPNGYRSYHAILEVTWDREDVKGNFPGKYYVELQLRTIAMDSWAALEHQLKYKKNVENQELIVSELKRVADDMAACDVSMQTIKNLIHKKQ